MGDSYWKYEQHQQQQQQQQHLSVIGKRQCSDYDPFSGIESARPINMGLGGRLQEDHRLMGIGLAGVDLAVAAAVAAKARDTGLAGGRPGIALPRDASNTL
ncbi:hypothetical protein Tco_0432316, partial [Tanacetum coccineum]